MGRPLSGSEGVGMKQRWIAWMLVAGWWLSLTACMAFENYNPQWVDGKTRRNIAPEATVSSNASAATQTNSENTDPGAQSVAQDDCLPVGANGKKVYLQSDKGTEKLEKLKVGAAGYGAPPKNYYPEGQRRLMTIRASKVDAYRALAEVVGGLHIWGGTAIADMVVERDRYRLFIDTYVRGARVVSIDPHDDGTYMTTVEMEVSQPFLNRVMAFVDPDAAKHCEKANKSSQEAYAYRGDVAPPSFYYGE
jgi:hypothetical protein